MDLVAFVRRLKALDEQTRRELLADAWRFKAWLVEEDGGEQMMRHILVHLLFPDQFERIASGTHKYRIRDQLVGLIADPEQTPYAPKAETEADVDLQLLAIREEVAELMPDGQGPDGHIDFYESPLLEAWDPDDLAEDDTSAGISNVRPLYCG